MPAVKNCGIEVRYRDGRTRRFNSLTEAKLDVQVMQESATIEHVCVMQFCIAGRCVSMGKKRRRRR
jgi:hypothetical protein